MKMNSFGDRFRLTTFGESHGPAIGGVIDGCPSGWRLNRDEVRKMLERRRPGAGSHVSGRREPDYVEFLSGLLEDGMTLGSPIGFIIRNEDSRSEDYESLKDVYRPGHADYTWEKKYGVRDYRGGGRSSARETAVRVVGGAVAAQWLFLSYGISVRARLIQAGSVRSDVMEELLSEIERVKKLGDSTGGIVECVVRSLPVGVGEPVGDKLQARLAGAMMSINAAKGFEYGEGFSAAAMLGSESNDPMRAFEGNESPFVSNNCGGILGGISNGEPVIFRVAFKPTPSIPKPQKTIDNSGRETEIRINGRHDPCVALRAVPVVEAMAAMTIADLILLSGIPPMKH